MNGVGIQPVRMAGQACELNLTREEVLKVGINANSESVCIRLTPSLMQLREG